MILDVRRKSDNEATIVDTELVPNWDELYVWLSGQPLGRFKGEPKETVKELAVEEVPTDELEELAVEEEMKVPPKKKR